MIVIGYSGHAFVVIGILKSNGETISGYCDFSAKDHNPFNLEYLGNETSDETRARIMGEDFFIGVGDNEIRKKIFKYFAALQRYPVNAIHPSANIDSTAEISNHGVMISGGVQINPLAKVGNGVICNTGCIVEHECSIGDFAHIGPGAILCGNVSVGEGTFVGAGSVIRQGIKVGKNVMIGAGSIVVKDIEDDQTVMGNPSKIFVK